MKKTTLTTIAMTVLMMSTTGCDFKKPLNVGYEPPRDLEAEADSTIYGFCGRASTSSTLQLISMSNDDTLMINVDDARKNNQVMGEYEPGDQLYVVASKDHKTAYIIINEKLITKKWVEPSPYDGSTPVGVNLKPGGEAEGIEQTDINYTKWRILNGRLLLTEINEDTGIEIVQDYIIRKLTNDSLLIYNKDESFEFGVQGKEVIDDDMFNIPGYDPEEEEEFLKIFD